MNKFIVHCGMPKTGTSLAQHYFNNLSRYSIINYVDEYKSGIAHHKLANEVIGSKEFSDEFFNNFEKSNLDILISSENFSNGFGKNTDSLCYFFGRASAKFDLQVYLVLRRLDSFLDSMYCQQVRFGRFKGDIDTYIAPRLGWFKNFLYGVSSVRGEFPNSLNIYTYRKGFDIIHLFQDLLYVDNSVSEKALIGSINHYAL